MHEIKESVLVIISTPVYGFVILAEILITYFHNRPAYSWRGTLENLFLSACNISVDIVSRGVAMAFLLFFYSFRFVSINHGILYWVSLVVGLDFLFYFLHLVDHRCRLFWAIHVTHHSSEEFNFSVGFRSSVFQPLYRFFYFIPLALLGFRVEDIYLMYSASQIYGILLHTKWNVKIGWLDYLLVTPSHHRVHHGTNPEYIDKNMGMILIIWDRLFGTFQPEEAPVKFGITKPLGSRNPVNLVFHEWREMLADLRSAPDIKAKFRSVFGPPETRSGHR